MTRVPIASLTGHLLLSIFDCMHNSVMYAVKKGERETAWERSRFIIMWRN